MSDNRGRWFRVYAMQVRDHDKFRDLSVVELGAWSALRSEAELRVGHVIADRAEAVVILKRRRCPRAGAVLDELIARRLFDVDPSGRITVHDREDHDRPRFPSDDPKETRRRKAEQRARASESRQSRLVTSRGHNTHAGALLGLGADSVSVSETDSGSSVGTARETPDGWDAPDAIVAYHDVTGRMPSDTIIDWLNRLSHDHPEEAIAAMLASKFAEDSNLRTLMSRTENALRLDVHRRAKAEERARNAAMAKVLEPHLQREREATPEEREQAELQRQAIRIGFSRHLEVPTDPAEVRKFVMRYGAEATEVSA